MAEEHEGVTDAELIPIGEVPDLLRQRTQGAIDRRLDTIRDWCKRGLLRSRKIAGSVYVDAASIDTLLEGNDQ